jgi:glutathione peroxidase
LSSPLYQFDVTTIDGLRQTMAQYSNRVLLIVNVASQCGFTPQYAELERLHRTLAPERFAVLGFPCDQFGRQEPGSDEEIRRFCADRYDVTFPLFTKIEVNGPGAHPLFDWLKREKPGLLGTRAIKWNFTKFLVDAEGRVVGRYGPRERPLAIEPEIRKLLNTPV